MDSGRDFASFDREWPEFLREVGTALPGVQLLFGFLLTAPFSANFPKLTPELKHVYFVCFLCTSAACAFLVAPGVYHRLHWRRDVRDKEQMLRTCNALAIAGVGLLAVAMTAAIFVIASVMASHLVTVLATAISGLAFSGLWFVLPLVRRRGEIAKL
jgi:Family of unknown function (DUF6328)